MFFKKRKTICPDENKMCAYCENAGGIGDSGVCVCKLKGVVRADGICKRFKFDLLKLEPRAVKIPDSSELFTY